METKALRQPDVNWVGCACCLNLTGRRVKATTIVGGLSVCDKHVELVSQPGFSIAKLRDTRKQAT